MDGFAQSKIAALAAALIVAALPASADPDRWSGAWPDTDFSRHGVPLDEIISGGVPKDGIPAIDDPRFNAASTVEDLGSQEPVIAVTIGGETRGYPLRILTWHEIVNDTVGGQPVSVTYCPLCNSSIVFDRRVDGRTLDFGTTGKLRKSDLVMYDRQTESWWQQFLGEAIVGEMTGRRLTMLPSAVVPFGRFLSEHPDAKVLVPANPRARPYGENPYAYYDSAARPFLYQGDLPEGIPAMARVVAVGTQAWSLDKLRREGTVVAGGLTLTWEPGMNSALDSQAIAEGRDVGTVRVTRGQGDVARDVVHDVTFAFVFHAFHPDGTLHID